MLADRDQPAPGVVLAGRRAGFEVGVGAGAVLLRAEGVIQTLVCSAIFAEGPGAG